MASKRERLLKGVQQSIRKPEPQRLQVADRADRKGYRVVAVSLYTPEANWIDDMAKTLQAAGNTRASRSLVVREAILRLQEQIKDKEPEKILEDFTEHQYHRTKKK